MPLLDNLKVLDQLCLKTKFEPNLGNRKHFNLHLFTTLHCSGLLIAVIKLQCLAFIDGKIIAYSLLS